MSGMKQTKKLYSITDKNECTNFDLEYTFSASSVVGL